VSDRPTTRLLRRSRHDRVIGGVCGGLGRYLGIDPVLLRIAAVILTLTGGLGVLLYLLAFVVIPEQQEDEDLGPAPEARGDVWIYVGVGMIALARSSWSTSSCHGSTAWSCRSSWWPSGWASCIGAHVGDRGVVPRRSSRR
jgi:phage shock protein PspC (stress-responsive transcriptional regulator)